MVDLSRWAKSLTAFDAWLSEQSQSTHKFWLRHLKSKQADQVEGAIAEAVVWDYLGDRTDRTRLNDRPTAGGVDFEFVVDGVSFFVEVTNISIESATAATRMPDTDLFKGHYGLLTRQIRRKVRRKLNQAGQQSTHPVLVAVTTLHRNASRACIDRRAVEFAMSSPPRITSKWNPNTGETEGELYQSTDLQQSVFLSPHAVPDESGTLVAQAKYQPISGFLLGGFGVPPRDVRVFGALNPEASNPFDPSRLADIPFCSFRQWPITDRLSFDWTITEEEEKEENRLRAEGRIRAAGGSEFLDSIKDELRGRTSD